MFKDFSKMETFLTVYKEKSFSKASKKLGVSQPAVTQQIKILEEYINAKIIERKKNGIKLTKEGEEFLKIVQRIDRCLNNAEKELVKIINKKLIFNIGSSFTIGNYILPNLINNIKDAINNDVMIKVDLTRPILEDLLDKRVDLALIESPIFLDGVIYREWMEDELVLFSNSPLPRYVRPEDLYKFDWICREEEAHTRKLVAEVFEEIDVDCNSFNVLSIVTSSTTVKHSILKADKTKRPVVSIISKYIIEEDLENGKLYMARIRGKKILRSLYIAYLKDKRNDAFVDNVVNYIVKKSI